MKRRVLLLFCLLAPAAHAQVQFNGGSPWIDVTSYTYGAKCDGSTNDTSAIQNAINAADGNVNGVGGVVFFPPTIAGPCLVSSLVLDGKSNITFLNGMLITPFSNNAPTRQTLKFTGTGVGLSMNNAHNMAFYGMGMYFPNATGMMVNIQSSGKIRYHGCTLTGPGISAGIVVSINTSSAFIDFDDETVIQNAAVLVQGDPTNAGITDQIHFDHVQFYYFGTSAIENAASQWTFNHIFANVITLGTCVPFLSYVGGYTQLDAISITNSLFDNVVSSNACTYISVPSVTAGTGYGKLTLISNVFLGAQGSTNNSLVNVGNNQTLVAESNDIRSWAVTSGAIFTLGTGVVTNISANGYGTGTQANGTFMAGTNPIGGWIVDNNGKTTKYPQIAADMTTQAAAFPLTNMYIVPTSGNGQYRVCYDAKVTRAATTSSVLGGSAGFQVQYVDNDDSVVVTTPAWWGGNNNGSAPTSATINTTQAYVSGCFPINAKPANAISIQFGYTSAGATSMQYNLHVRLEQTQ